MDTDRTLIDVPAAQFTIRSLHKVEVFDVYHTLKLPSSYEELSVITVVNIMVESHVPIPKDLLEKHEGVMNYREIRKLKRWRHA